jgi:hypothetical protein
MVTRIPATKAPTIAIMFDRFTAAPRCETHIRRKTFQGAKLQDFRAKLNRFLHATTRPFRLLLLSFPGLAPRKVPWRSRAQKSSPWQGQRSTLAFLSSIKAKSSLWAQRRQPKFQMGQPGSMLPARSSCRDWSIPTATSASPKAAIQARLFSLTSVCSIPSMFPTLISPRRWPAR